MTQVVKLKQAIEIFINQSGSLTIHQSDGNGHESVVLVEPEDANAVANAILEVSKEASE